MNHGNDIKWHREGGGRLMKEALSLCRAYKNGAEESTIINQWISSMVLEDRFFSTSTSTSSYLSALPLALRCHLQKEENNKKKK